MLILHIENKNLNMKSVAVVLILVGCLTFSVKTDDDDGSNKLIELLQEMESVVSPSAKDDVEGLIDVTKNIQKSAQEDDLKAAIEALKTGEKYVKQLLKHLDVDSDFHDVYEEVLKENQDLNQKLNENEAGFNDITKFVNNINDRLEPVLKKSKSN